MFTEFSNQWIKICSTPFHSIFHSTYHERRFSIPFPFNFPFQLFSILLIPWETVRFHFPFHFHSIFFSFRYEISIFSDPLSNPYPFYYFSIPICDLSCFPFQFSFNFMEFHFHDILNSKKSFDSILFCGQKNDDMRVPMRNIVTVEFVLIPPIVENLSLLTIGGVFTASA